MINKFNNLVLFVLKISIIITFFIFICFFSLAKEASGDEFVFLKDLDFIQSNGWLHAISGKISVTYLILAYPFSFLIKNYLALRLVNFLLFGLLLLYFKKYGNIKSSMFYFYFLFYSQIGWFTLGTNDALFIVSLVVFFNEVYKFLETKNQINNSLLYCSIIVAFFTRELFFVYFPAVILAFYLLYRNKFKFFKDVKTPILLLVLMVFINIPSLITNNKFSYDNKIPPKNIKSNWSQRQYLAQLMVNNGSLENESHPTWEATDAYLLKNGLKSLPKSILESVFFDLKLTFTEFFKNFASVLLSSIRQTALIILILLCVLIRNIFNKKIDENLFIPFIMVMMISIFSLIIITYIELRWLVPVFIMSLINFSDLEFKNKLPKIVFSINNIVMLLIIFYGTYRVLNKF